MSYARIAIRPSDKGRKQCLIVGIDAAGVFNEGHVYEFVKFEALGEIVVRDLGPSLSTVKYDALLANEQTDSKNKKPILDIIANNQIPNWAWEIGTIIQDGRHLLTFLEHRYREICNYVNELVENRIDEESIPDSIKQDVMKDFNLVRDDSNKKN